GERRGRGGLLAGGRDGGWVEEFVRGQPPTSETRACSRRRRRALLCAHARRSRRRTFRTQRPRRATTPHAGETPRPARGARVDDKIELLTAPMLEPKTLSPDL